MLIIDENLLIARGSERKCYAHPSMPDYCLKVPVISGLGRSCPQCRIDVYTAARLKARNVPLLHAPDCLGWVETSMGPAILVERIIDLDGKNSLTLKESIETGEFVWEKIEEMLNTLKKWAVKHAVVISELNVKNLMYRKNGSGGHLVIIDGLGGRKPDLVFFLRQHIPWMARQKTKKRWPREFNKVKNSYLKIMKNLSQKCP